MKEVIAIIRRNKIQETKSGLLGIGVPALTMLSVEGRGRQKGLSEQPDPFGDSVEVETALHFIPKRMISTVVTDEDVPKVVDAIIRINRTGNIGDGKIFVCPVEDAIRVRTGDMKENALL
jgi:nitrogen regulatory protein PII 2